MNESFIIYDKENFCTGTVMIDRQNKKVRIKMGGERSDEVLDHVANQIDWECKNISDEVKRLLKLIGFGLMLKR